MAAPFLLWAAFVDQSSSAALAVILICLLAMACDAGAFEGEGG